jgi:hypothetical protein
MVFDRLDATEDIEENRRNLIAVTQKVFTAIVSSADKYDFFVFLPKNLMFNSLVPDITYM